jgi:hypothetical protein
MEEDNIYEYEGTSYSESTLREAYPDTFDEYVNQGILVKQKQEQPTLEDSEDSLYEYDGKSYSESVLREAYPDTFDEYVNQGILVKQEGLGKQIAVQDSAAATDMELVSEDGLSGSQEKDTLLERTFGKNTVTDFFGDLYRAGVQGVLQAEAVDPAIDLMTAGADSSARQVYEYVQKNKEIAEKSMESDEMKDFNRVYDENGGGAFGFLMGVIESPTVLPSLFVSSMATQVASLQSEEVAGAALIGAGAGTVIPGVGTAIGGFTAAATAMEAGLTFSELLEEQIEGEVTAEKVRAILDDPEKLSDLRTKAIGRGVAIGAVEGLSAGLAKGATGAASRAISKGKSIAGRTARKALVPLTGGAVEVVGGMTGEVAGRLAADQEMDVKEIGFEGFAGLGSAPISVLPTTIKNINIVSGRANAAKVANKGGYNNVSSVFDPKTDIDETTMELAVNKNTSNIVDEQVEIEVANGRMTQEESEAIKENFRDTQGAVNTANKVDRLSKENKPEAVKLLIEEEKLKNKIKYVDNSALTKTESERLKQVQARLEEISNPKEEEVSETETETEEETGVPPTQEESETVETAPAEETIPQESLEELEVEIQSREGQGSLLDNAKKEEKVYLNGKEGNIKFESSIDPTSGKTIINENTIIFESGDEIIELGNKDEVGSEPIAGFGLTTMPPEGLDVQAETEDSDVVSIDGKEYNIIGRSKDKKGKSVVKVKEVGTGLVRRIKGAKAERVLKDVQLRKKKKESPLPLTTEGKEVTTPTKKERRAERVAEKRKAREEYDKKSLDELSQMEEESQRSVQEFEEMALEEAAQESKNKDLVQVGENIFQVTKNEDGSFAVSQMNESGRLIGTREEGKRSKAIGVFKSKKSNQERRALAKAEKLIDDFKKEELQRIDDAINERLSARQQKAEGSKSVFNERISAPESIVTSALKVLRNSYASGMTIMQSIDDALSFIEEQGFSANEFYFKKFVLDTLKTPKPKETTKERVLSKFVKGRVQNKVRKQVENARKALSKIAKGVTIEVYETQQEFEAATNGYSSPGIYDPSTKTIKINLEKANPRTVAHEVFHALLLKDGITNARAQKVTSDMMAAVRKVASPKLLKQLDAFADQYKNEGLESEESIAELFGILAENYESSPQSLKDLINDWLRKLAKILNVPVEGILDSDKQVLEFLDVVSGKVARGEVIEQSDIALLQEQEQGSEGEVGTIKIPRQQITVIDAPDVKDDPRDWIRKFVEYVDINEFDLKKFITNMYDYTNAGKTDLGNGYSIELLGGRNYVPLIMNKMGKILGEVSNLAAFNTKSQAEGFVRNAIEGEANLFAPHSGTLEGSWQFQQHIFEELANLVLDKNILTNEEIIKSFNAGLVRTPKALKTALKQYKKDLKSFNDKGFYKDGKQEIEEKPIEPTRIIEPLKKFLKEYNKDKKLPKLKNKENLNDFIDNPKELVRLLDIKNNFSPDLRKRLNQKIITNEKFKKSIGITKQEQFHQRIMDPLNKGVVGGEIMTFIQFDPTTFEIVKTNPGDVDHHPSFGWTVKAKIERIMQPNKFFKSYDLTESYTKFNKKGPVISRRADTTYKKFKSANVSSSAGAIVKKAEVKIPETRQQKAQDDFTIQDVIEDAEQEGLTRKETIEVLQELGFTKDEIRSAMKPVKEKARSVASETTGLSPREAFKQGFTEFFDAIQRGKKEARQKAAENLKEKVNKVRESFKKRLQKEKDNKDARAAVVKEIRAIVKDSGISQFSKRTINKIMTNVKNTNVNNMQRMVDEVMDVVNRDIDRKVRAARYKTLNAAIKKLSRLGALKELQKPLMGVLSINPDYLSKTALNFYDRVVINLANVEKKFDSRDSRENLKNDAEKVIKSFTEDNSRAEELAQKTINPNLDLTKTKGENLKQMLKDGLISDSDFELMTRFKTLSEALPRKG